MTFLADTFLNTYLWSHIEPATAIWCACLMTYRPLFVDISSKLRGFFDGNKQNPANKRSFSSKTTNSSTGFDSDAWPSPSENPGGQESAGYRDLHARGAKGNLHVVDFPMKPSPPDLHSSSPRDEYECSRIAVGREASLV